jgi:hypothetical protein
MTEPNTIVVAGCAINSVVERWTGRRYLSADDLILMLVKRGVHEQDRRDAWRARRGTRGSTPVKYERAPQDGTIARALLAKLVQKEPPEGAGLQWYVSFESGGRYLTIDSEIGLSDEEAELIGRLR